MYRTAWSFNSLSDSSIAVPTNIEQHRKSRALHTVLQKDSHYQKSNLVSCEPFATGLYSRERQEELSFQKTGNSLTHYRQKVLSGRPMMFPEHSHKHSHHITLPELTHSKWAPRIPLWALRIFWDLQINMLFRKKCAAIEWPQICF